MFARTENFTLVRPLPRIYPLTFPCLFRPHTVGHHHIIHNRLAHLAGVAHIPSEPLCLKAFTELQGPWVRVSVFSPFAGVP